MCCNRDMMCVGKALRVLTPMISEARRNKIDSVVATRTQNVSILLEDVQDRGNVNAVVRSMEAFGFLNIHQVASSKRKPSTERKKQTPMRTDAGALQWINMKEWSSTEDCVRYLKEEQGYKIACATPNASFSLADVDFCQRVALAFGSEGQGLSESLVERSDITFSIPMVGFVQSFNVSVSVALTLHSAFSQRVRKMGRSADLSKEEQDSLKLRYYMNMLDIKSPSQLSAVLSSGTLPT